MRCPFCDGSNDKVVNSRETKSGDSIRRRRECLDCSNRWTTFEEIERATVMVVKRDGSRMEFDPQKVLGGVRRACHKRPVSAEDMDQIVRYVERELQNNMDREIPAQRIGELVLKRLRDLDEVAFLRYASVFHYFEDISDFREILAKLLKHS